MSQEDFDYVKTFEQRNGFSFEKDIPLGRKAEIKTVDRVYYIERKEEGIYISGDEPFKEPVLAKIYGISNKKYEGGRAMDDTKYIETSMEPNFVEKGFSMEILAVNTGQEFYTGLVTDFRLLPGLNI